MPSVVAKRPKIPSGILGRWAYIHRQIPHEGRRERSEETPQNFHPGRMGLASGKGRSQTDPGERGGLRNGGGTAEMADARHTRKRSLCISNLRSWNRKHAYDANKLSRSPSSADSRAPRMGWIRDANHAFENMPTKHIPNENQPCLPGGGGDSQSRSGRLHRPKTAGRTQGPRLRVVGHEAHSTR